MGTPAQDGVWTGLQKTPGDSRTTGDAAGVFVIHACLLHTGNVLWFSGHVENSQYFPESHVFDPVGETLVATSPFPITSDIFCCGHLQLPNGKIITAGGADDHHSGLDAHGIHSICVFDPSTNTWEHIGDMDEGRWYPTLVMLGDSRIIAVSGYDSTWTGTPDVPAFQEILHPPFVGDYSTVPYTNVQKLTGADKKFPTYPGLHLCPDGLIYHTGTNWRYDPGTPMATPIQTWTLEVHSDTNTGTWTNINKNRLVANREEGMSVLLPPAQDGKILLVGGGYADINASGNYTGSHKAGSNLNHAEILDTQNPATGWVAAGTNGALTHDRMNVNLVILPDKHVLVLGGHNGYKWENPPTTSNSNIAELYDPLTDAFREVESMTTSRTYHSAALLLPDGRVLVAGGVLPGTNENDIYGNPIPLNQKNYEFYEPPYMHQATAQPSIDDLLSEDKSTSISEVYYGQSFFIKTADAPSISEISIMRPGAMTHHTDTQQRYVEITGVADPTGDGLMATMPTNPNLAPPGYYMVWILNNSRIPCNLAQWIRLKQIPKGLTVGTRTINGVDYTVSFDDFEYGLSVVGEMMPFTISYMEDDEKWYTSYMGLMFRVFDSVDEIAEAIIEIRTN